MARPMPAAIAVLFAAGVGHQIRILGRDAVFAMDASGV